MDRHCVHPSDVRCDEPVPPAHSPDTAIRTVRCHQFFHVDCACEELSTDDH